MAFAKRSQKTPTTIGPIQIILNDPDGTNAERSISGTVHIYDQDGNLFDTWQGNVQPHLTSAQINGLVTFLDAIRTQAEQQLLP